eukprot:1088408-Amphidinium_carterae.1
MSKRHNWSNFARKTYIKNIRGIMSLTWRSLDVRTAQVLKSRDSLPGLSTPAVGRLDWGLMSDPCSSVSERCIFAGAVAPEASRHPRWRLPSLVQETQTCNIEACSQGTQGLQ